MDPSGDKTSAVVDSPFVNPDEEIGEAILERDLSPPPRDDQTESEEPVEAAATGTSSTQWDNRPRAPLLRPTIPGLSSTVSSLSASRGVGEAGKLAQSTPLLQQPPSDAIPGADIDDSAPLFNNHNLIQMLNLVGHRFLEAEGNGVLPLEEDDDGEGEGEGEEEEEERKSVLSSSSASVELSSDKAPSSKRERKGMLRSMMDDDLTPKGGRSPLTSSMANIDTTARTPARQRLASQIIEVSSGSESASGSQELSSEGEVGSSGKAAATAPMVTSSTESSQSDVSATGMQLSIHALSTAADSSTINHRAQLIDRLKHIFDLDQDDEISSCYPCWLFRGVLLQGYIYILTSHVCFYAYMPSREDRVLKAGTLRKRTRRTHRFSRHWAVLRGRSLSWYDSNRDPYFPQDHIDLRNVLGVAVAEEQTNCFTVETPYRTFLFEADTAASAQDWTSVLKRSVFRAQNEGESVRISIPFEAVIDVEGSDASALGNTEWAGEAQDMVSIKVVNAVESASDFSMDEYFFLNLSDPSSFIEEMRGKLINFAAAQSPSRPKPIVRDSTSSLMAAAATSSTRPIAIPTRHPKDTNVTAATGLESQLADAITLSGNTPKPHAHQEMLLEREEVPLSASLKTLKSLSSSAHSYPPSPSKTLSSSLQSQDRKGKLPQWVKEASSRLNLSSSDTWQAFASKLPGRAVRESWSAHPYTAAEQEAAEGETHEERLEDSSSSLFSVLEAPEREGEREEADAVQHFRQCFALPDAEKLLGHLSVSLYRVLPVTGRVYISTNYVCFRSSRLASKAMGRTLMILPKKEIISVAKNNAFRFGHHGLVIIVRGHEELFLEFASTMRRDQCIALLDLAASSEADVVEQEDQRNEALMLTDLGQRLHITDAAAASKVDLPEPSPKLFNSASSTFLASRPREQLHITFLTIGSRGDVQPYIAFARGLMQEGHSVRIATHGEFRAWIESFGIEFREVGGDPAELMRICVDNGTFTVAFLRESMTKFRGWLDDLLVSCWHACQGTDVVVESPSAIAGIHVAEALQVPYYRSFTMPWTRTRVYPHAFAVPGHKAGGNYNYMSYVIFDQVFWRASAGQINKWRRQCLSLKPTSLDKLEQHKVPFLYNFSPNLVPKPIDWYDWIHVTGFWFLDRADESGQKSWDPPVELVDFIARAKRDKRKLVYIGWGSIVVSNAREMTRIVIESVKRSGVCAVLSKGWSDRLQHDDLTASSRAAKEDKEEASHPDVFTIQSIPHDWLFPQMDAACHHGGSGTLGASLRAGIPTVVKPYFGDQFFWASQVESLNVGVFVREFTVEGFSRALQVSTTDVKMLENARKLGETIRSEKGVKNAIQAFYGDWEYACSRIPRGGRIVRELSKGKPKAKAKDTVVGDGSTVAGAPAATHGDTWTAHTTRETLGKNTDDQKDIDGNDDDDGEDDNDDDDDGMDGWSVVSGSEESASNA